MQLIWTIALALGCVGPAQQPDKTDPDEQAGWFSLFAQTVTDYEICLNRDPEKKLKLQPAPALRWSQPVRGGDDGALFLWCKDGRPEAVGTIFAWPDPDGMRNVQHEFHSLAFEPLTAVWRGRQMWAPTTPGIELKPIPDAPVPADSATRRLAQMRTMARDFSANSIDYNDSRWELRLLAQPLYRYESSADELADGALFAFAQGTDPELLLLMEARKRAAGYRWEYACARFSDFGLQVRHKSAQVWEVPLSNVNPPKNPYAVFVVEKRKPPTRSEQRGSEQCAVPRPERACMASSVTMQREEFTKTDQR